MSLMKAGSTPFKWIATGIATVLRLPFWPANAVRMMLEFERLHFGPMRRVKRGARCVVDRQTWLINGHNITLGDDVKISAYSSVMAGRRARIHIGSCTIVGPNTLIVAVDHGFSRRDVPIRHQEMDDSEANSITIGSNVWVGGHVVILPGSQIGDGAIIAAGTLVRGAVPANTITFDRRDQSHRDR